MKRVLIRSPLTVFFLAVECVLYLSFLSLDLFAPTHSTILIKYTGVLFCLLFSLLQGHPLVSAALVFTAGADWFLLVRGDHLLLGVGLFCVVQVLYALRLHRLGSSFAPLLRLGSAAALLLALASLDLVSPLNVLALVYFSQLVSNAILTWRLPNARLFALGLTLFIGCDLCVGTRFAFALPTAFYSFVSIGMWFFYLPSQVLIALSGKEPSHENK